LHGEADTAEVTAHLERILGTWTVSCDLGELLPEGQVTVTSGERFVGDMMARPRVRGGHVRFPVAPGTAAATIRMPGTGSVDVRIVPTGAGAAECGAVRSAQTESGVHVTARRPAGEDVLHSIQGDCFSGSPHPLPEDFFVFATTGPCRAWLRVSSDCGPIDGPPVDFDVVAGSDAVIELTGPSRSEVEACPPVRTEQWLQGEVEASRAGRSQ